MNSRACPSTLGHDRARRSAFGGQGTIWVVGGVLLVAMGCAGTGSQPTDPTQAGATVTDRNRAPLSAQYYEHVFQLQPGGPETDDRLGYTGLVTDRRDGENRTTTLVYDPAFTIIGFYLDNGATFIYDEVGKAVQVGNYGPERSLQVIYKVDGPFRFQPLESAR